MPQRTLCFRIRPDGRVEERVEGVSGHSCHTFTGRLEAYLGTVEQCTSTSDAFRSQAGQTEVLTNELH
ncbi:hypothetical protein OMCYN_00109 [cyanobiont of Ornithocercus magnificus]|nr:hypothetical protein OMCYN_00109 [cyanobiont of Ornithocercus magnificus]